MKNSKKIISALLSLALLLSMTSIPVSAVDTEQSTALQVDSYAIKSNDDFMEASFEELLEEAIDNRTPECNVGVVDNANAEEDLEVHTYVIQDEVLSTDNASDSELRAITYASEIAPMSSGGHKYEQGSDGAYAVKAYSTIYYSSQDHDGNTLSCLTKVTGGYSKITGVSVSSQSVTYGMSGIAVGGVVNVQGTKKPTGTAFAYNTGFNKYVTTASSSYIGCTYSLIIKRGTGSYTYALYNNL